MLYGPYEPRFKKDDQKRKIGGGVRLYAHKKKDKVLNDAPSEAPASGAFSVDVRIALHAERHAARVLLSDAINAADLPGHSRWRAAMATIAMSIAACQLHTDRSGDHQRHDCVAAARGSARGLAIRDRMCRFSST